MLVALGILLWNLAVPCPAQAFWWQSWWEKGSWWQQEIPPPPEPNQVINPEYLKKQEDLNNTWLQLNRQNSMTRQHHRWTRNSTTKYRSDIRALQKANRLTAELKKTPLYIEQGAPPAPGPEPVGDVLLKY